MESLHKPTVEEIARLKDMATKLRIHSINMTNAANSGHPSTCSSMAEIISVLFYKVMRFKLAEPRHPSSDRFILSKGHAAPILYAAWAEAGLFPTADLLNLRKISSDLEGHPTPRLSFIDVATGSLGQGLSVACGMAYTGKHFDKASYRTYCLLGDGESMEGSVWEALHFAGFYKLDNLCAIIDVNRLGQSDPAPLQHDMETYRKRIQAFGVNAIVVDGHDVEELCKAFHEAETIKGMPTCILAKTFKGKDFPDVENVLNWHGKPLGAKAAEVIAHLEGLLKNPTPERPSIASPVMDAPEVDITGVALSAPPAYSKGQKVATREAYGIALAKLATAHPRVVALDCDVKNSTFSMNIMKVDPNRFIECFIAEQNLVGVGIGVACRNRAVAFISTFACFLTRGFDQLRMGVISQTNLNVVGSHAGVSIGEDGPSQMALEDLAMFQSLPGCTVFYPTDAVAMERATELAANTRGICFIRAGRPALPVLYDNEETFQTRSPPIAMAAKFQLVEADNANFEKMMEIVGVPAEKRARGLALKPIVSFVREGDDKYVVSGSAEGIPERTKTVTLGVEIEETTIDGRKVKSTYTREGTAIVQKEVQENGKVVTYVREIKGDELHCKVTLDNLVAHRVYKKL